MNKIYTFLICLFALQAFGQSIADFENFDLEPETFLNGNDGSAGFQSAEVFLHNNYVEQWDSWDGWAISNTTDVSTPGFLNQYSAITGSGANGSSTYATTFVLGESRLSVRAENDGLKVIDGLYITNGTYPFLSMQEGDSFAKKFGGADGNDPDFFLLTIKKYSEGELSSDSINFYLADYRFEDNSEDYIIDDWTYVDLSGLGQADSLSFVLSSSDVGQFGMNTPAYFCIDEVEVSQLTNLTNARSPKEFKVINDPSLNFIQLIGENFQNLRYSISNMNGQIFEAGELDSNSKRINVSKLSPGIYGIFLEKDGLVETHLFVR